MVWLSLVAAPSTRACLPVNQGPSTNVSAMVSTINVGNSFLKVQTTVLSSDSAVARLARLVEEAQAKTSPTENLVETIAKYYTPIVFGGAILLGSIPWAWGGGGNEVFVRCIGFASYRMSMCPSHLNPFDLRLCPRPGSNGIVIKGGIHLETLSQVSAVAVDKTGTVTKGRSHYWDKDPF